MKISKYYVEKYFLCYWTRIFNNETMEKAFDLRVLAYAGLSKGNCFVNRSFVFLLWEILKNNFGGEVMSDREAYCGLWGWMAAVENPG